MILVKRFIIFFLLLFSYSHSYSQKKDKAWFLLDSIDYSKLSDDDRKIFDSILPVYHNAKQDTTRLSAILFLANSISDETIWPRYNLLLLQLAGNGGKDKTYLKYSADAYNNLGYEFANFKADNSKAIEYYEKSIKIREEIGDKKGICAGLNNLGDIYQKQGQTNKALETHKKALAIREQINDLQGIGISLLNIGYIYKNQGNISGAVECYLKSLGIFEKIKDKKSYANTLNNIGKIYFSQDEVKKALEYYEKSIKIYEELGEKQSLATGVTNIGMVYFDKGNYELAMKYYKQALKLREEINDKLGVGLSYLNLARIYKSLKDYDKAIEFNTEAKKIFEASNNQPSLANALSGLAICYYKKNNSSQAAIYAKEALSISRRLGFPNLIMDPALSLYKIYKDEHNTSKALEMFEIYSIAKDSLLKEDNKKATLKQQFKFEYDKKAAADSTQQAESLKLQQTKHEHEIAKQRLFTYGGIFGCLLMLIIAVISYRAFKNKQQATKEITVQKHIIEEKQKEIIDSINYAKRIQYALMSHSDLLEQNIPGHFTFFKPKAIVSGDFFWVNKKNNLFYLAVCDSTGHGVPGAFMSLLNISFLNEAINEKNIEQPNEIFNYVRMRLIESISRDDQKDGFDGILLCFDKKNGTVTYSASNNKPVLINEHKLTELITDKMPVGKGENMNPFTLKSIPAKKGDTLYLYSDGFADQFGGPQGKKFKYKPLNQLLLSISDDPMPVQFDKLSSTFENWKGELEQVDDILVIGIKV